MTLKRFNIYLFVTFLSVLKFSFFFVSQAKGSVNKTYTIKVDTAQGLLEAQIHTSDKNEEMVKRISQILNHETRDLINYFEWVPDAPIHIIIKSSTYSSNGSATVFPRLKIVLNDRPPVGSSYLASSGDWMKNLLLHELVHIIHMSQHRGVVDLVDTLFGSIGRSMTGIVPRWFTEGVAVWAETEFTDSGRLRDEMMIMEARKALANPNFCSNVECLSLPNFYPYGHSPYWLGGMFIDYIEKNIPGAVRCIINSNSSKVPFMLDRAFSECLEGSSLNQVFALWKADELEKLNKKYKKLAWKKSFKQLKPISFRDQETIWYRGSKFKEGQLFYVEHDPSRQVSNLISYNVANQKKNTLRTDGPILGVHDFSGNKDIVYFSQKAFGGDNPAIWSALASKKHTFENFSKESDYVYFLKLDNRKQYAFKYKNFVWELVKITKGKEKVIRKFTKNEQIQWPYINSKSRLQFFVYDWEKKAYTQFRLEGLRIEKDFSYKGNISLLDRCHDKPIMKLDKTLAFYNGKELRSINHPLRNEIALYKGDHRNSLYWLKSSPENVYYAKKGCHELTQNSNKFITKSKLTDSNNGKTVYEEENFYKIKHLAPDYWFLNMVVGNTMTYYSIFTHLTDPSEEFRFNLNVDYYATIQKVGGTYSFDYDLGSDWSLGALYLQGYDLSTINNDIENQRAYGGNISKKFSLGRVDLKTSLRFLDLDESDFISKRNAKKYSLIQTFKLNRVFADDFINKFNISAEVYKQNTKGRTNFVGQNYYLKSSYFFSSFWLTHLDLSYGKMDKSDISSGAVFAGETNNHRFIGLDSSSAFSNELAMGRAQFDFKLFNSATDFLFFPVLLKQTRFIVGAEWLKSKYVYIGPNPYVNKEVRSYHSGLRFKTQAFYYMPITIDIFYAKTEIPGVDQVERTFIQAGGYIF